MFYTDLKIDADSEYLISLKDYNRFSIDIEEDDELGGSLSLIYAMDEYGNKKYLFQSTQIDNLGLEQAGKVMIGISEAIKNKEEVFNPMKYLGFTR